MTMPNNRRSDQINEVQLEWEISEYVGTGKYFVW